VLINWYYQNIINPEKGEALAQVKRGHLAQIPIRAINPINPDDVAKHDRMVSLVEQILDLHKKLSETRDPRSREQLQRRIDATDAQIDRLVYELYDLTEDEIRIVEESR